MEKIYKTKFNLRTFFYLAIILFASHYTIGQCLSSFTFTTGTGGNVNFTSTSSGTLAGFTYYQWDFGDGGFSSAAAPSHNYIANGVYTVSLTVIVANTGTCVNTSTQTINVTSASCTTALNSSFNYVVNAGGQVNFTSTSTGTNANTYHRWYFGDGGIAFTPNTSHTYLNGGTHPVSLVLSDSLGFCKDSSTQYVNINTIPCTANSTFTLVHSGCCQTWYAIPAYYGNVLGATWNWGDGNTSNTLFTSHTYSATGVYNICLTVSVTCAMGSNTCNNYNIYKTEASMLMATVNVVTSAPTGILENKQQLSLINAFPNPANNQITFEINDLEAYDNNAIIRIYNILGQEELKNETSLDSGKLTIDIHSLNEGIYTCEIKTENKTFTKRIIKSSN